MSHNYAHTRFLPGSRTTGARGSGSGLLTQRVLGALRTGPLATPSRTPWTLCREGAIVNTPALVPGRSARL